MIVEYLDYMASSEIDVPYIGNVASGPVANKGLVTQSISD